MSMKRARKAGPSSSKSSASESTISSFGAPATAAPTWDEAMSEKPDDAFRTWSMQTSFSKNDLLDHPKFGRGLVTLVDGARIEVLFKEGAKKLAHAG